ncbi:LysR family transcriptional regulator [Agrobacterium vaccinii]|uniref:LysR family transcriptional regulator n=1 Tax=Agrobacterium vaccinii TaxID=2735528 RepID=UPI001E3B42D5|nr:LysR family transcriptional regulator [Agrobacterium vaccinii]
MMSENGLRYLLEALNAGSMRAAGDRLNVAASSVSRQIAQLEEQHGIALIVKGRRGIKLTDAGEMVMEHYRNQMSDREALRAKLEDLRSVKTGSVTLSAGEGFLGETFTDLINSFNRDNPKVRLNINIGASQEIARMVADDEAHMGLVFQTPHDMKIQVRSAIAQPLMVIVPPDHPLARQDSVTITQLQDYPLCLSERSFRLRQILSEAEAHSGQRIEPAITTNSIFVMLEAVRAGVALTILPQLSVWSELRRGTMVSVPIADDMMEKTSVSLILRAGRKLEGAPARFLIALERLLRQWAQTIPRPVGR